MSAVDLAIAAGVALTAGWVWFWLHRRGPRARLARLTRTARIGAATASAASGTRPTAGNGMQRRRLAERAGRALLRRPVAAVGAVMALNAGVAVLFAGPVAAVVAALYTLMALVAARRALLRRDGERAVAALLDTIDATAEGLRAGTIPDAAAAAGELLPAPPTPPAGSGPGRSAEAAQVARARVRAAYRLSESLGVPLADLLDRVDADLRTGQALRGGVAAQLSAAQATAGVLLALPVAGLWVGAALGTHPAHQLLHTPLGAACAVVAVALQCGGFLWTGRMVHAVTAEVH
ncbi:type II secretion system F family protein [Dactylosporangium sp. CA-092794]|uniref:type II secretion system F family protein n=1 Tax=Dactylosporangium sp. CA-092794 TaxID=3239929 RepID=UPI003D90F0A9